MEQGIVRQNIDYERCFIPSLCKDFIMEYDIIKVMNLHKKIVRQRERITDSISRSRQTAETVLQLCP